ncbi:MAG: c-type cytochrome [Burkholderiaceae bacterium]
MFKWTKPALLACVLGATFSTAALADDAGTKYGIGRTATEAELKAWDIDVRPDFKGIPKGSGTVDQGADIWDATCAACHGSFGESNSVFTPLVGGTTAEDIKNGHVKALTAGGQPSRTTFMKVSTVSTLWDYIHRAMPWDNPKSLEPDEVYAVLAYLLNLAEIVPSDFTLSDETMAQVQEKMPNRKGMKFWAGLWTVDGKPDTSNVACMADCATTGKPSSTLPPHARDAHGDLAAQMRIVGPVRGVNTQEPALSGTVDDNMGKVREHARATLVAVSAPAASASGDAKEGAADGSQQAMALLKDSGCMACHATDKKVLGPSFVDIAAKYKGQDGAVDKLVAKVQKGGSGAWGAIPMPPHPALADKDAKTMVEWILTGAGR